MLWPLEDAAQVMKLWRDLILSAPDDLNGWFAFLTVPPAPPFPEQFHLQDFRLGRLKGADVRIPQLSPQIVSQQIRLHLVECLV